MSEERDRTGPQAARYFRRTLRRVWPGLICMAAILAASCRPALAPETPTRKLRTVVGILPLPHHAVDAVENRVLVALGEQAEGASVAPPGSRHQQLVGLRRLWHRGRSSNPLDEAGREKVPCANHETAAQVGVGACRPCSYVVPSTTHPLPPAGCRLYAAALGKSTHFPTRARQQRRCACSSFDFPPRSRYTRQ